MEEYRPIKDFEDVYEISNLGNVNRILKTGKRKPMKIQTTSRNAKVVVLTKKNKKTSFTIMRLVFNAFAPKNITSNGKEYDLVLKNKNKNDCSINNIQYYPNERGYRPTYDEMTDCQKFAHDTKYITYFYQHQGKEYFLFRRIINYKEYQQMYNADDIEENLDLLKMRYKGFLKSVEYQQAVC